jgi:two-component system nitrogen regulation response regulator GlnG
VSIASGSDGGTGNRRLLIVDDDGANCMTLSALLEDEGFSVDAAQSCAQARVRLAASGSYAAVLVDGNLGDGSGLDLVGQIRASQPGAPILLVSGSLPLATNVSQVDAAISKGEAFETLLTALCGLLARFSNA